MGHASNKLYADLVANLPIPANRWPRWIVTGGGVGFLRPAPGSWGTIPPAALYGLMLWYNDGRGLPEPYRSLILLVWAAIFSLLLIRFGKWACTYFRKPDPGQVIIDEYAGFALAAAFLPIPTWCGHDKLHLFLFVAALYILFRLTDTLKLPPARQLERLPFGWGILLDDLASGLQANLLAQLIIRLWLL